jgi:hypothetical protein
MTTTVDTETRLLSVLQQLHTLRRGIAEIAKKYPDAPAAMQMDLLELVLISADEALDAASAPAPSATNEGG